MDTIKLDFIAKDALAMLDDVNNETNAFWGVMNAHQMIEHLSDFFEISTEKITVKLYTDEAQLPLYKAFLLSDKAFRENTKAPLELLGEDPLSLRFLTIEAAKENLQKSVKDFIAFFEADAEKQTLHPVFGMLTFDEWVLLHHKHVLHHLKQFGKMDRSF